MCSISPLDNYKGQPSSVSHPKILFSLCSIFDYQQQQPQKEIEEKSVVNTKNVT